MMKNIRNVVSLNIHAHEVDTEHELVFEFLQSSGIKRTYKYLFSDCDIITVGFDDASASRIKADPKVFTQLLDHIHMSQEISIEVSHQMFRVRSFHSDDDAISQLHLNASQVIIVIHVIIFLRPSISFLHYRFTR